VIFHMLLWIGALLALRQILFQDMERGNPPRF